LIYDIDAKDGAVRYRTKIRLLKNIEGIAITCFAAGKTISLRISSLALNVTVGFGVHIIWDIVFAIYIIYVVKGMCQGGTDIKKMHDRCDARAPSG
jgi:hypothetical protein